MTNDTPNASAPTTQLGKVAELMGDGCWRTLDEIYDAIGRHGSHTGVSARLRDLRKQTNGGHDVERERVSGSDDGVEYVYRVRKHLGS